ncbi:hypothetical protein ACUUL3_11470 [Thiovibrio sp. JS02]
MRKNIAATAILLACLSIFFAGCGVPTISENFLRENVDFGFVKNVAVLPFENNSKDEFAPERVRDIMNTQLLSMGLFDAVDKGMVDSILREEGIDPGKPLDRHAVQRLGQRMSVQAILFGTIDHSGENRKGSNVYPELDLTVRMLEVQSGVVIWQASGHGSGDSVLRRLFGLAAHDSFQVTMELVNEILSTIPKGGGS